MFRRSLRIVCGMHGGVHSVGSSQAWCRANGKIASQEIEAYMAQAIVENSTSNPDPNLTT